MEILPGPFCDFVNFSLPADEFGACRVGLADVLGQAGGYEDVPGLYRLGDGGAVKLRGRGRCGTLSVSGAALAALRQQGAFDALLWEVAQYPHRVTLMHATLDVAEDAPAVLRRLYRRGKRGEIRFTRKACRATDVGRHARRAHYSASQDTGTVYLGRKSSDVWSKVYDKRNHVLDVALRGVPVGARADVVALNDPGPLTRYELCVGRHMGLSLRDVAEPASVFWHFMGQTVLRAPPGVREWVPSGDGYALPEPGPVNHALQLELLLENSPDVRRAVSLADKLGPHGRRYAQALLAKMFPAGVAIAPRPV